MDSFKAKQKFILSMVASSLLVACNDSSSDPKGSTSSGGGNAPLVLSGTAIDGYLENAKVCLDKNADMKCDVSDGQIVRTDKNGQFTLPYSNSSDLNFPIIVEAISGETIDSDHPNSAIEHSFGLVAEANNSEVITPFTTLVIERAKHDGVSYQDAEAALAAELSITVGDLGSDYVAGNNETDQQLHALARSVTQLMKDAEQASLAENVDRFEARKALHGKLAMIDVSGMKKKTDVLVANGTVDAQTLKVVSDEVVDDVKITSEEVSTGITLIKPPTPKNGVVDDKNDLFGWAWAGRLTAVEDYEYSADNGVTWLQVTANPQPMGDNSYSAGTVQVRVKAKKEINRLASDALKSGSDFAQIVYITPAAPTAITINDANNTFTWGAVSGYDAATLYEYSLDNGATWLPATGNPQSIADQVIAVGHLKVRVKAQSENHVLSGESVASTTAMTLTPTQPSAPAITGTNDASDTFTWALVTGFTKITDYEYNLGNGWVAATTQTISVGDINIPADTIKVRVKADPITGRAAGIEGVVSTSFSKDMMVLPAPMNAVVDDGNNTLTFTYAAGFSSPSNYQISYDSGVTWHQVTNNPHTVSDKAYSAGQVAVRTFNSKGEYSPSLLNKEAFTVTPAAPNAPTSPQVDDASNTFGWTKVTGFGASSDYEFKIGNSAWRTATANPMQVDNVVYAVGAIQVRVKADAKTGRLASSALTNHEAYTVTPEQPVAPTAPQTDDAGNTFGWNNVAGFSSPSDYEIKIGAGAWQVVSTNPVQLDDKEYTTGSIIVRVKEDVKTGRPAGRLLSNTDEFTITPDLPSAPTAPAVNDADNSFGWTNVAGFILASEYEVKIGASPWQAVTQNPVNVPDQAYGVGEILVRVKTDTTNGRPAGQALSNDKVFTVTPSKPAAPTAPVMDDAQNTFAWTNVTGFDTASDYEIKVGAADWTPVSANPMTITDGEFAIGDVKVRVKADPITGRVEGDSVANTKAFTLTPAQPSAPTGIVVNDSANTFDWAFVTGFTQVTDYELSKDNGNTWLAVTVKPVNVGDNAYGVGQVQVRVKANAENGMPAGLSASNPSEYFDVVPADAPTLPVVVNTSSIKTNGLNWTVTAGFDQITDYEFTNDGGTTWQDVVSIPQHIGHKAYDKTTVGVRVKSDSKLNRPAGNTLWATTATVDFEALKYVQYGENGKPLPLSNSSWSNGDWSGSKRCEAYYETENAEPVFWLSSTSVNSDRIDTWIADANQDQKCNLGIWQAPSYALVKTLSGLADTNNKFIHTGSTYWGKKDDGTYQAIQDGADYTGDTQWRSVYLSAKAVLPATSEVKSFVVSTKSALELGVTNSQTSWQTVEQDWTGVISGLSSTLTLAELTQDKADVTALIASLPTLISQIETVITAQEANVQKAAAYIALVQQRAGLTEQDKALLNTDLAAAQAALKTLKERKASAEMLQKAEKITSTYIDLRIVELALTQSSQKLDASLLGGDGALMHSDAQALYAKLEELKQTLITLTAQQTQFSTDLTAVSSELVAQLLTQFGKLTQLVNTKVSSFDTASLKVHEDKAKQGFESAWQNGYSVSADQAKVATNFAKLDINGKYLPTATTYAQGWRCVMDLRNPERNRVWNLLQNGLGNGVDDMAYEASSAKTLLGAGGFLEATNQAQLCGYNDWKVPSYFLFETLKTKSFPKQYGGTFDSIDTDVFPNHKGHEPYESYTSPRYYYWASDSVSRSDEAAVLRFQSQDQSERKDSSERDGSDQYAFTLARLVRETPIAYQLLLENGTNTTDRSAATCVVDPTTNLTWQLFTAADAARFKTLDDIKTEATSKNSCGKSAWRLPTVAELQSLYPVDNVVFPYSVVPKNGLPSSEQYNANVRYATSEESNEYGNDRVKCVDMTNGNSYNEYVGQSYSSTKYSFIYRLVAQ